MSAALAKYEIDFPALTVITSDAQNEKYTAKLIELRERRHLTAEEREYARLLSALIEKYEDERYPVPDATAQEVLRELIAANGLRQKDLVSILGGHESVVSEIVNGKRPLSRTHIEKLSQRFRISPAVFFPKTPRR